MALLAHSRRPGDIGIAAHAPPTRVGRAPAYRMSRQRQARKLPDLYFKPPLHRVAMLEWARFDSIVRQGHAHACQLLHGVLDGALDGPAEAAAPPLAPAAA